MMAKVATKAKIKEAALEAFSDLQGPIKVTSCHIFFGGSHRQPTDIPWRRLRSGKELSAKLRESFSCIMFEEDDDTERLVQFDYESVPADHVAWLHSADIPTVADWLAKLPATTTTHIVKTDSSFLADARYQAARLQTKEGAIVVFQRKAQAALAKKGSIIAFDSLGENEFKPIKGTVVNIETRVDFVQSGDFIFIKNFDAFEKMTNLREITLRQAQHAVDEISSLPYLTVNNLSALPAFLETNLQRARRLAAASARGMLTEHSPRLLRALSKQLKLPVDLRVKGAGLEVDLDAKNAAQMKAFIDLMTEYYVKGATTRRLFKAPFKQPV